MGRIGDKVDSKTKEIEDDLENNVLYCTGLDSGIQYTFLLPSIAVAIHVRTRGISPLLALVVLMS